MSRLRFRISMSLDGFVAGPEQTAENPLGVGGDGLHDWVVPLKAWRQAHGKPGGEVNESSPVMEESEANLGATIMGRNMFGGGPGPWDAEPRSFALAREAGEGRAEGIRPPSAAAVASKPWRGWWGNNPPFHHPVFVLTHHPRPPLALEGGTTFTFVTQGIQAALELARAAAGGKDVALAGGARVGQQYLAAGLLDEMEIHLVPILLGGGARLFQDVGADLRGLTLVRTVATPAVTHLKFSRR